MHIGGSKQTKGRRIKALTVLILLICTNLCKSQVDTIGVRLEIKNKLDSSNFLSNQHPTQALLFALDAYHLSRSFPDALRLQENCHSRLKIIFSKLGAERQAGKHAALEAKIRHKRLKAFDVSGGVLLGAAGSYFLRSNQKDSCFWAFNKANNVLRKMDSKGLYYASSFNNLGLAHKKFGAIDSAIYCYKKCLAIMDSLLPGKRLEFRNIVEVNLAQLYSSKGNVELAKPIYQHVVRQGIVINPASFKNQLKAYMMLANIMRQESKDSFYTLISNIQKFINKHEYKIQPERRIDLYSMLFLKASDNGNQKEAKKHFSKIIAIQDSLLVAETSAKAEVIENMNNYRIELLSKEKRLQKMRLLQKDQQLAIQSKDSEFNLFVLLSGLLATLVIGFFIVFSLRRRSKQLETERKLAKLALENKQLEQIKLETQLEGKNNDLIQLALENSRKREWSKELIDKLKQLRKTKNQNFEKMVRQLEMEMGIHTHVDHKMGVFHDNIDQVNSEFYKALGDKYPELTKGERELCGMIKLNLSGKEIANIRNVHPRSISKAKQRLRKKLGTEPNADLYKLMEQVIE